MLNKDIADGVWLLGLPISPTDNHMYLNKGRFRIKSPAYRAWEKEVEAWHWKNRGAIKTAQGFRCDHDYLSISVLLKRPYSKFFCKDGSVKRTDASNYSKATFDMIAKLLNYDDKYFFDVSLTKVPLLNEVNEWMDIFIKPHLL